MARIHAIEIHEQDWCPAAIRDAATDYLQFVSRIGNPYGPIVERLVVGLRRSKSSQVLDLCSGGGGPWFELQPELSGAMKASVPVRLSDLHPNRAAFERARGDSDVSIDFVEQPVSVSEVPPELEGFRTLFASFHHFRPDGGRAILTDAVRDRRGIGVFEPLGRSVPAIVSVIFAPLMVLLVTPFIRPFRWSRLVFTYLIPIVPLVVIFDGVVSCLRTYTPDELRDLVAGVDGALDYDWDIGSESIPRTPMSITYLIGVPRSG